MKAIQIKYLGPTAHKGTRLKAFTEAGTMIESRDYELNADDQARNLAIKYAAEKWKTEITGFGTLPNGDFVATVS